LQPPIPVVDGESEKYQADSARVTGTGTKKTAGSTLNPTVPVWSTSLKRYSMIFYGNIDGICLINKMSMN
jgi:hypothetical protein